MKTSSIQLKQAISYLDTFIPKTDMNRFPGEYGLKRTHLLLELLGNPQEKVKVVHIAGTSGKGSTATIISHLLTAHGFKVGLHVKPHLLDIRERFQINNANISAETFIAYLEDVKKAIVQLDTTEYGQPTYFEVVMSLAYYIFYKEHVDYAVVETGVGGQYDGSNTIHSPNKLVLLTSIGFDHMAILGNTLEEIATQKALIMQKGNIAFSIDQKPEVKKVFEEIAIAQGALLRFITSPLNYAHVSLKKKRTQFDFYYESYALEELKLHMSGSYQAENTSLALAGLISLAQRDGFTLNDEKIREMLLSITYPARFEIRSSKDKTFVIDGAHNTQKMEAFLSNLVKMFPERKFCFVVSFKKEKEIEEMVKMIAPLASTVYVTGFFNDKVDFVAVSEEPEIIGNMFQIYGVDNVVVKPDASKLIDEVQQIKEDIIVTTGSFYMISDLYPALLKISTEL